MASKKPYVYGFLGAAGLLIIYFGVLIGAESVSYALYMFSDLWYWIVLLAIGFGTQLGLHTHIKAALRQKNASATAGVAASGGVSTVAMVACCAHHVTDVLPILGLSAAAVFLVDYQTAFILLGVFSNLIGVTMMLRIMQKHSVGPQRGPFKPLFALDMKKVLQTVIVSSVVAVVASFLLTGMAAAGQASQIAAGAATFDLAAKENSEKRLSVEVKPVDFTLGKPARFEITLNTHGGSLDFDLTKISVLEDDQGKTYKATGWDGPPPGGHHRSGTLAFPALGPGTKTIKLTLKGIYDVPERVFEWPLR
jgi:hypothetical protein